MPRNPKATRVITADKDWQYYNIPGVGPVAGRYVTYEDGTVELHYTPIRSQKETDEMPNLPPGYGTVYEPMEKYDESVGATWNTQQRAEQPNKPTPRTAEQQEQDQQAVVKGRQEANDRSVEAAEKQYNFDHPGPDGKRYYETNQQRATRERAEIASKNSEASERRAATAENRAILAQESQNEINQQQLEISRGRLQLDADKADRDARKPTFLSQANAENPFMIKYNEETGLVEALNNPNFDAVKQESERIRAMLAVEIQARNSTLDEAKQKYSQWYDTNVKIPMMQAQEARDRAAEQRAALDAEERRRQFAANFSLQKGELGQRAGAAAMQAEQSLLPYRAGPTEAAEMSSAINSLGAGGNMNTNASAGINFTPGAFQFDAPDFGSIAKKAAAAALKGISTYKPSGQGYSTADYSSVPAVNTSGAPDIPQGYGAFDEAINRLKSTYQFGGQPQG